MSSLAKKPLKYSCFHFSLIMGEFQTMHKYFTIFVAVLVACHGSLFAHGRQIKPLNQHSSLLNTKPTILAPLRTSIKLIDAPIVPKFKFADVDSGDSGADHANAFRPTTPGNSPGVGHKKFEGEDKGMKVMGTLVHSPDVKASVADAGSFENDFRPTDPGHSPGVGHPRQNKIN
ncbi:hypothetical protein AAZX31_11G056000 [Glycine max]